MIKTKIKALKYGYNREPKVRNFIYSIILSLSYFLIIGVPILLGYFVRIIRKRYNNKNIDEPPKFRPITQLVRDGIITISYALYSFGIPVIALFITNSYVSNSISNGDLGTFEAVGVNSFLSIIYIIVSIGIFVFPSMVMKYVVTDKWKSGYNLLELRSIVLTKSYFFMYSKFILVSVVVAGLSLLTLQTLILIPLGAVIWYTYITVTGAIFGDYIRSTPT